MKNHFKVLDCLFAALLLSGSAIAADKGEFTSEFPIGDCQFTTVGGNPYFILQPGRQLRYDNARCFDAGACDEYEELVITVLGDTHAVAFSHRGVPVSVNTRVVEERETVDGELAEVSRNFFAECAGSGDVYYFGEEVDIYEGGTIVSHDGAWEAGMDGALPGIIVPGGAFLLGARYYQEIAPGVALDRAEHTSLGLSVDVPAGRFTDCVQVEETTPLEKKALSTKIYCGGIGLVYDDGVELTGVF